MENFQPEKPTLTKLAQALIYDKDNVEVAASILRDELQHVKHDRNHDTQHLMTNIAITNRQLTMATDWHVTTVAGDIEIVDDNGKPVTQAGEIGRLPGCNPVPQPPQVAERYIPALSNQSVPTCAETFPTAPNPQVLPVRPEFPAPNGQIMPVSPEQIPYPPYTPALPVSPEMLPPAQTGQVLPTNPEIIAPTPSSRVTGEISFGARLGNHGHVAVEVPIGSSRQMQLPQNAERLAGDLAFGHTGDAISLLRQLRNDPYSRQEVPLIDREADRLAALYGRKALEHAVSLRTFGLGIENWSMPEYRPNQLIATTESAPTNLPPYTFQAQSIYATPNWSYYNTTSPLTVSPNYGLNIRLPIHFGRHR